MYVVNKMLGLLPHLPNLLQVIPHNSMHLKQTSTVKLDGVLPAGAAQLDGFSGCHVGSVCHEK